MFCIKDFIHCVSIVQIRNYCWSIFSSNAAKNGPDMTPNLDTFNAVIVSFRVSALFSSEKLGQPPEFLKPQNWRVLPYFINFFPKLCCLEEIRF